LPDRLTDHLILVARDVCLRTFINEIKHDRDVRLGLALAEIAGDQPTDVLGKRNAKLRGLGLRRRCRSGSIVI